MSGCWLGPVWSGRGNREAGIHSGSPQLPRAGKQLGPSIPVGKGAVAGAAARQMCVTHLSEDVAAGAEHQPRQRMRESPAQAAPRGQTPSRTSSRHPNAPSLTQCPPLPRESQEICRLLREASSYRPHRRRCRNTARSPARRGQGCAGRGPGGADGGGRSGAARSGAGAERRGQRPGCGWRGDTSARRAPLTVDAGLVSHGSAPLRSPPLRRVPGRKRLGRQHRPFRSAGPLRSAPPRGGTAAAAGRSRTCPAMSGEWLRRWRRGGPAERPGGAPAAGPGPPPPALRYRRPKFLPGGGEEAPRGGRAVRGAGPERPLPWGAGYAE